MSFRDLTRFITSLFGSGRKRKRRSSQSSGQSDGSIEPPAKNKKAKRKLFHEVRDPETGEILYLIEAKNERDNNTAHTVPIVKSDEKLAPTAPSSNLDEHTKMNSDCRRTEEVAAVQLTRKSVTNNENNQPRHNRVIGLQNLSTAPQLALDDPGFTVIEPDDRIWASDKVKERTNEYEYDSRTIEDNNVIEEVDFTNVDQPFSDSQVIEIGTAVFPLANCALPEDLNGDFGSIKHSAAYDHLSEKSGSQLSVESDSPFRCRCGMEGNGAEIDEEGSQAIQCSYCNTWMHIACQRDGRASTLKANSEFKCDECLYPNALLQLENFTYPETRRPVDWYKKNLTYRLIPGLGALVRIGNYWYPSRIIRKIGRRKWRVHLWRECFIPESLKPSSLFMEVSLGNIVDELWGDLKGRRSKRLGKWTRSFETRSDEDIICEFREAKISQQTHDILYPHVALLESLLKSDPRDGSVESLFSNIPAMMHVRRAMQRKALGHESLTISDYGDLTALQRAEIAHWFHLNVPGAENANHAQFWLLKVPYAHAVTIYIATKFADEFSSSDDPIQAAWNYQTTRRPNYTYGVDIDKECLYAFEQRLFERTKRAGRAGSGIWGLDRGPLQDNWYPYSNLPEEWVDSDFEDLEEDLQTGPSYEPSSETTASNELVPRKPRPRPRPLNKGGKPMSR